MRRSWARGGRDLVAVDLAAAGVVALVLVAFGPPLLFVRWIRNSERYAREPWGPLLVAFLWGAIGGTALAALLETGYGTRPDQVEPLVPGLLFLAVVVAPFTEELTKPLGLAFVRDEHPEPEDGLVYGSAVGLGFAATENLLYELMALAEGGLVAYLTTAVLRTFASALLHASASALVGYAVWRRRAGAGTAAGVVAMYLLAVAIHGAFNLLASVGVLLAIIPAAALAIGIFRWIRRRVAALDAPARHASSQPPPSPPPW